ncbi:hypothetical protein [Spiroplasma ixodetis]|uniref:hypothetical protein n=1 Tax=Spiroplasma ixodetis TaxID=2141 RepID=UPI0025754687|nr:hypothetical protein [Spiroplasma ixodetis]WJG69758.1 hypothetical protein SIXOD_v1c07100 [Spiroplasma ixodetis Y32]
MKNNHFKSKEVIENCERKKYNNKSDNHLQVVLKLNETILTDYFFCNEHTNEYKNKIWRERLEQFKIRDGNKNVGYNYFLNISLKL